MPKRRVTGAGVGSPFFSANLSWEYIDSQGGCLVLPGGQLPKVGQAADPIMLGVHPSAPAAVGDTEPTGDQRPDRVPPYVSRDIATDLRNRITASSFVLIVGDSSAGKSRLAFEVISELQDHVLVVPRDRGSVVAAVGQAVNHRRCVLWLDDLEGYLGSGGLTRVDIAALLTGKRTHRVIMATLRAAEEAALTSETISQQADWPLRRGVREVLELAHRVTLSRMFSEPEQERARAMTWDTRIGDALTQADTYGMAEYLAAGPELLRDWEDAWSPNSDSRVPTHPRGAALITAAIDIRRAGYASSLPRTLLEQVHEHYLQARGGRRLRPEPLEAAWEWATQARRATTALLEPVDDDHVLVFDYLLDAVQRQNAAEDLVPDAVLEAALAPASSTEAANIGWTAWDRGRYELAETALLAAYSKHSAELGPEHPETLAARSFHANVLRELGRPAEAEAEQRSIAEIAAATYGPDDPQALRSRTGAAFALIRQGKAKFAEPELHAIQEISTRVFGPEDSITVTSRHLRAIALLDLGRVVESEAENRFVLGTWTRTLGPDHTNTLLSRGNLAIVLHRAGRLAEAEAEARAVLDIRTHLRGRGHPETLRIRAFYADILRDRDRHGEAECEHRAIYELATRLYGPEDMVSLDSRTGIGLALIDQDRSNEAEQELRAVQEVAERSLGPEHRVTLASRHLRAIALRKLGRLEEAEAHSRSVLAVWIQELGPENRNTLLCHESLAATLYAAGRSAEAEIHARSVLEARSRNLGPDHRDTVRIQSLISGESRS